MSIVVGLTGGIASGKSTVSNMLRAKGIPIVDADVIAREVVEIGTDTYHQLVDVFSSEILHEDGTLNRTALGAIIFHDEGKRQQLNSIMHPSIRQRMKEQTANYVKAGHPIVVMDIPLLFESKLTHLVEKTILVYVDKDIQLKRLMERNELSQEEALARIQSQMPLDEKKGLADFIIDNNGTVANTKLQLETILKNINE